MIDFPHRLNRSSILSTSPSNLPSQSHQGLFILIMHLFFWARVDFCTCTLLYSSQIDYMCVVVESLAKSRVNVSGNNRHSAPLQKGILKLKCLLRDFHNFPI